MKDLDGAVHHDGEIYVYRRAEDGGYWATCWGTADEFEAEGELLAAIEADVERLKQKGIID